MGNHQARRRSAGPCLTRAVSMSMSDFADARPEKIAQYLFARAGAVTPAYIAQARSALLRLLRYNHDHGVPWDGAFGQLSEVDLFSFLLSVMMMTFNCSYRNKNEFTAGILANPPRSNPGSMPWGESGKVFITWRSGSGSSSLRQP
jgi:hypothetical protein